MKRFLPPLIPLAVVTLVLEWMVRGGMVPAYLIPAPSAVVRALIDSRAELAEAMAKTSAAALLGFALSTLTGIAMAVALSSSRAIQRSFYPYAVFFQTVPIIAIAPLLVIWFGVGLQSKVLICALIVFFPILINTVVGLRAIEPELHELMRSLRATPWQMFIKLDVPGALPVWLGGLKVGATLSVIGAVVGEFVGADRGLGFLINFARGQYDMPLVFVGVSALVVIALALYGLVSLAERWLLAWKQ